MITATDTGSPKPIPAKTRPDDPAPVYFPINNGFYEVKPDLHGLNADFGNGWQDQKLVQIDRHYDLYRQAKCRARAERLDKYYGSHRFSDAMRRELLSFLIWRISTHYPEWFGYSIEPHKTITLSCKLTQETLVFDQKFDLVEIQRQGPPITPEYVSGIDAIACQLQEDLAVISIDDKGHNWISALHLCFPNYWAAQDKIGQDFATIHNPVAGIQRINSNADSIVSAMVNKGPFVRFSWGLVTDSYLNHHPEPAPGHDATLWHGRQFNVNDPKLFLRVERQTIFGFPKINSALFTIRTYLTDCRQIKQDQAKNAALQSAIRSMNNDSLMYKGLFEQKQQILDWLKDGKSTSGNTTTT